MRWNARAAALSALAVLLTAPLAAQAESSRAGDSPPLEGVATTATVPADPPPGQVVTIFVPSEPVEQAPAKSKPPAKPRSSAVTPAAPPPPAPAPPSPVVTAPRAKTLVPARARGGASRAVAVPPAPRGGPSFTVPVARSRQTASFVSALVARGGSVTDFRHPGKASRGWVTVLAAGVFIEALLITSLLLRRRRFVSRRRPAGT